MCVSCCSGLIEAVCVCVSLGRWANKDKDRGGNGRNGGQPPTLQSVSICSCETFLGFLKNYKDNILGFCNPPAASQSHRAHYTHPYSPQPTSLSPS